MPSTLAEIRARDIEICAKTLCAEARGEGERGMQAVANVIAHRAEIARRWRGQGRRHPLFGDGTLAGACLAPWQFSCWNAGDPNRPLLNSLNPNRSRRAALAWRLAVKAVDGELPDLTHGATHYLTQALLQSDPPRWVAQLRETARLGRHVFYVEAP